MHRVDAELTAGLPVSPISDEVATLAVDHCLDVMWGWLPEWATYEALAVVEFVVSGTGQRWLVEVGHWTGTSPHSNETFDLPRAGRAGATAEPAAVVTGTVEELALWAWNRGADVTITGSDSARAALDRLISHGID